MADAVETVRQHMDQEAPDELGCGKAHDGPFIAGFAAIIFPLERNGVGISTDQTAA